MAEHFSLIAAPMHGQVKLSKEGYRTRDGHLIEWLAKLLQNRGPVAVMSRPDPWLLRPFAEKFEKVAPNTVPIERRVPTLPDLRDRKRWWHESARYYRLPGGSAQTPLVVWNPFFLGALAGSNSRRRVVLDLLDDWSVHHAFAGIRDDVENAYRRAFDIADVVYANSEGTEALARRFGRSDVVLMPNGTDPDNFDALSLASGATQVGYLGKIGKRLDLELIVATARQLPEVEFVFAGPVLDREYNLPLRKLSNVRLLGDVHYQDVPALLQRFDVGWVPHSVGAGEVGGDAIKIYEYHAAGLPVVSTPIIGAGKRGLSGVSVVPGDLHAQEIRRLSARGPRVPRLTPSVPRVHTWEFKARSILSALDGAR